MALGGKLWVRIHLGGHGNDRGGHQRHSGRGIDEVLTFFFSGLVMGAIKKSSEKGRSKEILA